MGGIDGEWLMLGDTDDEGDWLRDGTADGAGTNGIENVFVSLDPNSPPWATNSPFDVTL